MTELMVSVTLGIEEHFYRMVQIMRYHFVCVTRKGILDDMFVIANFQFCTWVGDIRSITMQPVNLQNSVSYQQFMTSLLYLHSVGTLSGTTVKARSFTVASHHGSIR